MWRFLSLYWQRLGDFLDQEVLFLVRFCRQRLSLYQQRFERYNLFQWWARFLWTCFFGLFYGFLRFTVYALALGLRLFFLPFRLAVELYVAPNSRGQRFLLASIGWFESFFGLLWLRQWLIGPVREGLTDGFWNLVFKTWQWWSKFLKSNPPLRLVLFLERLDNKLTRQQERLLLRFRRVILDQFLGVMLPSFFRSVSYWLGVRRCYFSAFFSHPSWKKYRERYGARSWEKYENCPDKPLALVSIFERVCLPLPLIFYWGLRLLWLGLRFLGKLFSNPAPLSYRCRRPKTGRRFRRKRNWWDD